MATVLNLPMLEIADEVFAVDRAGNVEDLGDDDTSTPALAIPPVVLALTGRGREFGDDRGLVGTEKTASLDATRLLRDVTVRAFMTYEIGNAINGDRGSVCVRGLEDGTAPERRLFGLELERVSATLVRVRARWEESGGVDAVVAGATFIPPTGFFHVAAVRRWIDTSTVEVDYVVNDELIGSEVVTEGDIVDGSGGTITVGCAGDPGAPGDYHRFLPDGSIIDQLSVENDAMSVEELRQEYRRIAVHQPNGYRILRAHQPPGKAWNRDPDSRIQRLFGACGDGLGYALALMERLRDDLLPDRAYGPALAAWEGVLRLAAKPADTIAERRARVLGFTRRILGYQIDDLKFSLEPLFGLAAAQIEILEYTGLRTDEFDTDDITTPPSSTWVTEAGGGTIAVAGGVCTVDAAAAADIRYPEALGMWRQTGIGATLVGDVDGASFVTKVDITTLGVDTIVGQIWRTTSANEAIWIGRRLDGATPAIAYNRVVGGVLQGFVNTDVTAIPDTLWLLCRYTTAGAMEVSYSSTGPTTGFSTPVTIATAVASPRWIGFGAMSSVSSLPTAVDAEFDDVSIFEPNGTRAFNWQAYRDPVLLPATYDLPAAQEQLEKQGPAHGRGCAVDEKTGFALGPTGGGALGCDPLFPSDQISS